ncbi:PPE family protein [Mycobacterium persicum]|uniref:PPE family protein n=1 Tax=Mycobacterium persicum TaxID=1487726 RepID=UPI000A0BEB16|nr:PPE family protein [Mycobacterium persicum]ORC00024.1 hypothetical protein B1T48_00145 [Mycobacterium persicum]
MDFGALPPEVNSGRMYSGPGSAPMAAAATAWNSLAVELSSAATGYETVITQLSSEEWMGPASAAMAEAVAPYVAWTSAAAARAEQAAAQARAAAAAFETAFAAVVPPPLIAANRAQLAQAIATNVFGQNTSVIAALEAQYGEMWAQDSAAMYSYAGNSAHAAAVAPFASPPQITSPTAQAGQATAVAAATGTSGGSAQQTLNQFLSAIPTTLGGLAAPITGPIGTEVSFLQSAQGPLTGLWQVLFGTSTFPNSISGFLTAYTPYAGFFYNTEGLPYFSIGMANNFVQSAKTLGLIGGSAPAAAAGAAAKGLPGLGGLLGGGGPVSAGLGNAASVGKLSVPPVWSGQLPGAMHPGGAPLPVSTITAAPEAGAGNLLGGMPLAGAGAGAAAGAGPRYGFRPTVMARPPFAG